jgi:hypothetical protein
MENTVEVGFFYGSPLDLNSDELNLFGEFIFKTNKDYFQSVIVPRIHTFECPTCPKFAQKRDCLSRGKYCAFFPKTEELNVRKKDWEDYVYTEEKKEKRNKWGGRGKWGGRWRHHWG